jgi:cyclohexanecarboxylate-CoA ligase
MTRAPTHRPLGDDLYGQYTPIDDATAAAWRAAGWWEGRSICSLLSEAATTHPDRTALVGYRTDGSRVSRTYHEFDSDAQGWWDALSEKVVGAPHRLARCAGDPGGYR